MSSISRVCAVLTILLLLCASIALAGGQGEGTKTGAAGKAEAPKNEKVVLSWYSGSHAEAAVAPFRDALIKEFETANPSIFVEKVIPPRADTWNKFVVSARAGHTPDLFEQRAATTMVCGQEGWLQTIDDRASAAYLSNFNQRMVDACRYKGKLYGIPTWAGTYAMFYNTDLAGKAGVSTDVFPTKWDEYLDWAKKLTRDTNGDGTIDQWGAAEVFGKTDTSSYHNNIWLWSNGANMYNADMTKCTLDSPEAIEALKFRTDLFLVHKVIPPGPTTFEYAQASSAFAFSKAASMISANWAVAKVATDNPAIVGKFVIKPNPYQKSPASYANFFYTGIGRDCKNPAEAWKFIEFLNSKDLGIKQTLETNLISLRKDILSDPKIQESSMKPFVELLEVAGTFQVPNARFAEMEDIQRNMVHEVLLGQKSAEQAAKDATLKIDVLLKNP